MAVGILGTLRALHLDRPVPDEASRIVGLMAMGYTADEARLLVRLDAALTSMDERERSRVMEALRSSGRRPTSRRTTARAGSPAGRPRRGAWAGTGRAAHASSCRVSVMSALIRPWTLV